LPSYARVACFKGYDETSFSFNAGVSPTLFEQQFQIYEDLLREGFDMYAYVTLTSPPHKDLGNYMRKFIDRLQYIHPNLPLRTVPLKIESYAPTRSRARKDHEIALKFQYDVHTAWLEELDKRFSGSQLDLPIYAVDMSL